MDATPQRILIAKPGLDGHDVGARVVALALRDAGFEVIYTGLRRTPAEIAEIALQEGVDAVGLSVLSGAHLPLCEAVLSSLRECGLGRLPLVVGGNIPARDHAALRELGAAAVLATRTPLEDVTRTFREVVASAAGAES